MRGAVEGGWCRWSLHYAVFISFTRLGDGVEQWREVQGWRCGDWGCSGGGWCCGMQLVGGVGIVEGGAVEGGAEFIH